MIPRINVRMEEQDVVYLRVNLSVYMPLVEPLVLGIQCIFFLGGGGEQGGFEKS